MIMRISNFENDIAISDEYVRVLEIENKALFIKIVQSINSLCYNQDSDEYILLLKGDEQLNFSKDAYFIFDILNIDFNDRKILNKLYLRIKSSIYLDDEIRQKLEIHHMDMFKLIDSTLLEFPFEFTFKNELVIEELLKLYGIKLVNEGQSFIEKILYLIDLISILDLSEVLIFCNFKSFFTKEQLEEIYKHIIHTKLNVLLLEGSSTDQILKHEKKNRIDMDFDDYEIM